MDDADSHACEFNDLGLRCGSRGIMSPGTLGTGPWYCRTHAWVFVGGRDAPQHVPASAGIETLQAQARAFCAARGLTTVALMVAWIKANVGLIGKAKPQREPGEEG